MKIEETIIFKIGAIGMSEEITITGTFAIDTDWDQEKIDQVMAMSLNVPMVEAYPEFASKFGEYLYQKYLESES